MKTKTINVVLLSGLALAASAALAADPVYPSNPEQSFTLQSMIDSVSKTGTTAGTQAAADLWQETGVEHGYSLTPPKYVRVDGKFVHRDNYDYSAAKPGVDMTANEKMEASVNYRNAP